MEEQVQQIMAAMDFLSIQEHMERTGWTWVGSGVPDVPELRRLAYQVLRNAADSERPNTLSACGGFHAYKFTWDRGAVELRLTFEPWGQSRTVFA